MNWIVYSYGIDLRVGGTVNVRPEVQVGDSSRPMLKDDRLVIEFSDNRRSSGGVLVALSKSADIETADGRSYRLVKLTGPAIMSAPGGSDWKIEAEL